MDVSRRRFLGVRAPSGIPFRPPWSAAEDRFAELCSRCDACLPVCPTGLLKRGAAGYPEADFASSACTFCGECAQACSTGAISRDTAQSPWAYGIRIDERCLAARQVECRVCGEICDESAIRFRPRVGGVPLPEVDDTACTGCGACLAPCPTTAIVRVALDPVPELP